MKITEKGQVTIPKAIRDKMGFLPRTEVEFVVSRDRVVLRKTNGKKRRGSKLIAAMRGRATGKMSTEQIMELSRGE